MVGSCVPDSQAEAACDQSIGLCTVRKGSVQDLGLRCSASAFQKFFWHVLPCQKEPCKTLCCLGER